MEDEVEPRHGALPGCLLLPFHCGCRTGTAPAFLGSLSSPSSLGACRPVGLPSSLSTPHQQLSHWCPSSLRGCFGHFESFCSYLIALMEGKSKHHKPFPKLFCSSLPPSFTAFMGLDSSPWPQIHKVLSLSYLLYQSTFPSVNSFWLAGVIYCCLWRQDSASPGVQQALESHCLGWSPAGTLQPG